MKLLKLHIDNFGKLTDFDYDFNANLNPLLKDNGWGKTTLAAFIKAMLYGMKKSAKKNLRENERLKYTPWQGGTYGGALEFEAGCKQYRIERSFAKTEKGDKHAVYDLSTNTKTDEFGDSCGLSLFKIDAETFAKSIFVPQEDFDFKFGETIKAKLANMFGNLDDTQNAEQAIKALEEKRKAISSTKAKSSLLKDLDFELSKINEDIDDKKTKVKDIEHLEKEKKSLEASASLKEKEYNVALKRHEVNEAMRELYYKNKGITQKEIEFKMLNADLQNVTKADLDELDDINKKLIELNREKEIKDKEMSDIKDSPAYLALNALFVKSPLKEDEINKLEEDIALYKTNLDIKKRLSPVFTIMFPILILLSVIGAVLTIYNMAVGIALAICGILLACVLLLFMFFGKDGYGKKPAAMDKQENQEISLKAFFNRYELYETDFTQNINTLKSKYNEYQNLSQRISGLSLQSDEASKKIEEYEEKASSVLSLFALTSPTTALKTEELKEAARKYKTLANEINELKQERDEFAKENNLKPDDGINIDSVSINIEVNKIQKEKEEINKEINENERMLNLLYQTQESLEDDLLKQEKMEEEKEELEKQDKILAAAAEFIKKTAELVKKNYIQPMSDKVKEYLDLFFGNNKLNFNLDIDFKFSGVEDLKQRDIEFYSQGYRQAIALCLRLALIEVIFPEEKPFLLLDDPFVGLDNEKLSKAKELLEKISETKQVIYLTCHDSRQLDIKII